MEPVVLGLRVLLALACVIGLIWVLARRAGWGRGRRRPAGPAVEVIGRHAFGRHAGVAVVAVGDRRLLLGYGEQNVTMLTELDPADPAEAAALAAEQADAPAPLTLGSLAAAVLPRQRGARPAAAPVASSRAVAFEDALAGARAASAGVPLRETGTPTSPGAVATTTTTATTATTATAAAAASAAAALAAAAAIPVSPASPATGDVPGLVGLEVADVDTAGLAGLDRLAHPDRAAGAPADVRPGALHGSVLAPSTWKQAVAALRERTVRR